MPPLFVLGIESKFNTNGYMLLDMPEGNPITAERFSEFRSSFDYYQNTKTYEDIERKKIRLALDKETKPLILTEGDTDVDYLQTALKLFKRDDLLSSIDIEWIGGTRNGQQFFTGDKSLNNAGEFLRANPEFLKNRRVLLLYDSDTNKPNSNEENLWIRTLLKNDHNKIAKKGIENLLPESLFDSSDRRFYSKIEKTGDYGQVTIASDFNKRAFCNYICKERYDIEDFKGFSDAIHIINDFFNNTK
ncbi:hypothetical protein [Hymenobacter psychrotolerans]|uniref:Uncharacterized protein n=1 Tax=Hymenobacter psychrotolerans DSM 18569 TaxID=1121959 RepID=A0A1M6X9R1_9BACT|nr:hypothetical protein [Hymenobacter psychrotolerans]SHL02515.1 hypothetical protein SAMN02746009_01975 [Hymenobacter psychrotolerans DSM 18569]